MAEPSSPVQQGGQKCGWPHRGPRSPTPCENKFGGTCSPVSILVVVDQGRRLQRVVEVLLDVRVSILVVVDQGRRRPARRRRLGHPTARGHVSILVVVDQGRRLDDAQRLAKALPEFQSL